MVVYNGIIHICITSLWLFVKPFPYPCPCTLSHPGSLSHQVLVVRFNQVLYFFCSNKVWISPTPLPFSPAPPSGAKLVVTVISCAPCALSSSRRRFFWISATRHCLKYFTHAAAQSRSKSAVSVGHARFVAEGSLVASTMLLASRQLK
jgi:hypothetical protein